MPKRKRDDLRTDQSKLRSSDEPPEGSTSRGTRSRTKQNEAQPDSKDPAPSKSKKTTPKAKPKLPVKKTQKNDIPQPSDQSQPLKDFNPFTIPSEKKDKSVSCQRHGPSTPPPALIFTHGAGGGLDNPATALFASGFSSIAPVVCFQGSMNLTSRVSSFQSVLEHPSSSPRGGVIALGGRSMGARAAVIAGTSTRPKGRRVDAVVLVSYPLVGASKGDLRDQILLDIPMTIDVLFISGTKDSMCDLAQLQSVRQKMRARSWMVEVKGADHGMSLTPKSAVEEVRRFTGEVAARWVQGRDDERRDGEIGWDEESGSIEWSEWRESFTHVQRA